MPRRRRRLYRPWAPLVATGLVGGTDVATGVLAFLLVRQAVGNGQASPPDCRAGVRSAG